MSVDVGVDVSVGVESSSHIHRFYVFDKVKDFKIKMKETKERQRVFTLSRRQLQSLATSSKIDVSCWRLQFAA